MANSTRHVTVAQMREADRRCIEDIGIPGAVLMNNAGAAVFAEIHEGPVGIVCGKGNNGGDGFVVARLSMLAGYPTRVVLVGDPAAVSGDAAIFMRAYQRLGGNLIAETAEDAVASAVSQLADCRVLVDALLGTGTQEPVRGAIRAAIQSWPRHVHTVSVDIPSGLDADTGDAPGECIRADVTVSFQFSKSGFQNPTAWQWIGRLVVADIGIPDFIV